MASIGRVVADIYTNKRGSQVDKGMWVILDTGNDNAFTTTTTANDLRPGGVALETIANDADGRIQTEGRVVYALVQGSVTRGNYLVTSTTAGRLADASVAAGAAVDAPASAVAIALEAGTTTNIRVLLVDGGSAGIAMTERVVYGKSATGTTFNINSASYNEVLGLTATTRVDFSVIPYTHFRIYGVMNANAASQTITLQLVEDGGTTALSAGGDDLVVTDTAGQFDSGWIAFAAGQSTDKLLTLATKGSNATVDLVIFSLIVQFKKV